jgi:hypothetical protein
MPIVYCAFCGWIPNVAQKKKSPITADSSFSRREDAEYTNGMVKSWQLRFKIRPTL